MRLQLKRRPSPHSKEKLPGSHKVQCQTQELQSAEFGVGSQLQGTFLRQSHRAGNSKWMFGLGKHREAQVFGHDDRYKVHPVDSASTLSQAQSMKNGRRLGFSP